MSSFLDAMKAVSGQPLDGQEWRNYITIGDLKRCPYGPFEACCAEWCRKDDERIKALVLARHPELR